MDDIIDVGTDLNVIPCHIKFFKTHMHKRFITGVFKIGGGFKKQFYQLLRDKMVNRDLKERCYTMTAKDPVFDFVRGRQIGMQMGFKAPENGPAEVIWEFEDYMELKKKGKHL